MQHQTDCGILPGTTLSHKGKLHQEIKQLFSSNLFIGLTACYSLAQIIGLFTLSAKNPIAPLVSMLNSWGVYDSQIMEPLTNLSNVIQFAQLILLVPCIIIATGLWIIVLNAKNDGDKQWYRIGFTTIQIILFNQMVVALFFIPVVSIKIWSILNALKEFAEYVNMYEMLNWIIFGKVFLVAAAIGTIYFMFRVLLIFSIMKESVCESVAIQQACLYVPILCFLLGVASVLLQIKLGGDFASMANCATSILFAFYLLDYRKQMDRIERLS